MNGDTPSAETLRAHPKCLLTELDDGSGVVVNLDTKFYFTLNPTAVALWKELARGPRTRQELAQSLIDEFDVEVARAAEDVASLVDELLGESLLERVT